ncbi:hypothetical protein ACF1BE_25260 [Streptomyces sp. NPDC014991]
MPGVRWSAPPESAEFHGVLGLEEVMKRDPNGAVVDVLGHP